MSDGITRYDGRYGPCPSGEAGTVAAVLLSHHRSVSEPLRRTRGVALVRAAAIRGGTLATGPGKRSRPRWRMKPSPRGTGDDDVNAKQRRDWTHRELKRVRRLSNQQDRRMRRLDEVVAKAEALIAKHEPRPAQEG